MLGGQVPQEMYNWYLKWFMDYLGVESGKESESIYVDIVRHIVVNCHSAPPQGENMPL